MFLKIAITFLVLWCVLFFNSCTSYGEYETFDGLTIYYNDNIATTKVNALGNYLEKNNFTNGEERAMEIESNDTVYSLKMVIQPAFLDSANYISQIEAYAIILNKDVFGDSLKQIHLCDKYFEVKKSIKLDQ